MRRCAGCMESKPKNQLIRIAGYEGQITIDETEKAKGRGWENLMDAITKSKAALSKKFMWTLIKSSMKQDPSGADARYIRGEQGALVTSTEEALDAWRSHFERVANPPPSNAFDEAHRLHVEHDVAVADDDEEEQLALELSDVREALKAKEEGKEKVILFNLSGNGAMDLLGYDKYMSGQLTDYEYPEHEIEASMSKINGLPLPK